MDGRKESAEPKEGQGQGQGQGQDHGPAGPHDKPELRNDDATPGAGTLPEDTPDGEADAGAG